MKKKRLFDENIVVSIDRDTKRRVEQLARQEERPLGAMARFLIREALNARDGISEGDESNPLVAAASSTAAA